MPLRTNSDAVILECDLHLPFEMTTNGHVNKKRKLVQKPKAEPNKATLDTLPTSEIDFLDQKTVYAAKEGFRKLG